MKLETLEKLKIWCSPLTLNIYLGQTKISKGREVVSGDKVDVTIDVVNAVAEHLAESKDGNSYEFEHGFLKWEPKEKAE